LFINKMEVGWSTTYFKTGDARFETLGHVAGCDPKGGVVDFDPEPPLTFPELQIASFCQGKPEAARYIEVEKAFLYFATGRPFCTGFSTACGSLDCDAPWTHVTHYQALVAFPPAGLRTDYTLKMDHMYQLCPCEGVAMQCGE